MTDFNPAREYDTGLALVFEFVIYYKKNDQLVEMSASWADIELSELRKTKPFDLKLKGGTPLREVNINEVDIRANRKGWRGAVKMLSKPTSSKLKIEVRNLDTLTQPSETKVNKIIRF